MNDTLKTLPPEVFLWGAIGQAKHIRPIIEHYGSKLTAVFDERATLSSPFDDVPIYHGWDEFLNWMDKKNRSAMGFCIGFGAPRGRERLELHEKLTQMGLQSVKVIHPSAIIAESAIIGTGSQVMAGSIIGPEAHLGTSCIINAKVNVDHDNILGDGVEIAPGATLCGVVTVGENTFIGAGATILPGIKIGQDAVVGAGSVVNKDVPEKTTVIGIPAKPMAKK
jgi:sugar O-acyltransferase (sialic acid O-acetyltransferase NeuD family)